jgi:hypothetical protein
MTTNYRVMKMLSVGEIEEYEIRRVHYDEEGKVAKCTKKPVTPRGHTLEDLRADLMRMLEACLHPALDAERFSKRHRRG